VFATNSSIRASKVGHRRIARLMRELEFRGVMPRKFRVTTDSDHKHSIAKNVLDRNVETLRPNEKGVTDVTYIWTSAGWLYL
jgi:putative transposase